MNNLFLSASTLALGLGAGSALAQSNSSSTVGEVIVTGTRATGVKAADSAAPIQIIGNQALQRTGAVSLPDTLLASVPSLIVDHTGGDQAAVLSIAAIRGVSPNDTLVLIDGKRRHSTSSLNNNGGQGGIYIGASSADLSFIPVGAIDHVEALTDGAAAQYGSDAIAGVLNVILKTSPSAGTASATAGQFYEGDGQTGSWYINKGMPIGDKGFVNVTLEEQYHGFTQHGLGDRRVTDINGNVRPGRSPVDIAGIPGAPGYPYINRIEGDPHYNLYNVFVNSGYDITPDLQVYAFGNYSDRVASHYENYRLPSRVVGVTSTGATVYPFPHGFSPREQYDEVDYSIAGGIKGRLAGWNFDVSSTYGRNLQSVYLKDSANASLYKLFQAASPVPITPQSTFYNGQYDFQEITNNLDITRSFPVDWAAGPLNVALGFEQRRDTYRINPGEPNSYYAEGVQSFDGYTPLDAGSHSRSNYAVYGDFAFTPIPHLSTDFAVRYENYSDFGNTVVGKFTGRYDFNSAFAVRGTVSTGFRAPTLQEEFYSATNSSPTGTTVVLPANSAAAQIAGFQKLKPEKSDNYSLGIVLHPAPSLQITADAYLIYIRDRIGSTGPIFGGAAGFGGAHGLGVVSQAVLDAIAARGATVEPGAGYANISTYRNARNTRTAGVEVTATYSSDFDHFGHVDWSVGVNYNKTDTTKYFPLPAQVVNNAFGQTALPSIINAPDGTPPLKVIAQAFWTLGKFSTTLRETITTDTSELTSFNGLTATNAVTETVPTAAITDLSFDYRVTHDIKLTVGANNLFNQFPPSIPVGVNSSGVTSPISPNIYAFGVPLLFSPYGINGGFYYGRVTVNF